MDLGEQASQAAPNPLRDSPYQFRPWSPPDVNLPDPSPRIASAEKESDDPTLSLHDRYPLQGIESSTRSQVNSLFTSQSTASRPSSRQASFLRSTSSSRFVSGLASHIFSKGLLEGLHSDISVHVFGEKYMLHRLMLDQSPFLSSALLGPWLEASAAEISLHPEETDPNITKPAFELALKRLYGSRDPHEETLHCLPLFATACWLEMHDFRRECTATIIKTMQPTCLAQTINLVTSSYYGKSGEAILEAAKALLRREGSLIPLRSWDGISGDVIKELIASDEFFIHDEWHRWDLAKEILDRKMKLLAADLDLQPESLAAQVALRKIKRIAKSAPEISQFFSCDLASPPSDDPELAKFASIYAHSDIVSLLELLQEGIYYMHFDFQELQNIKSSCDIFDIPCIATSRLDTALWASMELRHKIIASNVEKSYLGLHQASANSPKEPLDAFSHLKSDLESSIQQAQSSTLPEEPESDLLDNSPDPRCLIPTCDRHTTVRVDADSAQAFNWQSRKQSDNSQRDDSAHVALTLENAQPGEQSRADNSACIPPFRFSVEFPNPRLLDESRHFHSQSVFYAGSFWNVYIRNWRPKGSRFRNLAVYLRRTDTDRSEESRPNRSNLARSVNQRIGDLERESLRQMREGSRRNRGRLERQMLASVDHGDNADESASDGAVTPTQSFVKSLTIDEQLRLSKFLHDITMSYANGTGPSPSAILDAEENFEAENPNYTSYSPSPVNPPYMDLRPSVQAYFKVYCVGPGSGMLNIYESAPEEFSLRKSWGWKRTNLLDYMPSPSIMNEDGQDFHGFGTSNKLRLSIVIGLV